MYGCDGSDYGFELQPRDRPRAEERGDGIDERQDGGFDAHSTGTSIKDEVDFVAKTAADVLGGGGR